MIEDAAAVMSDLKASTISQATSIAALTTTGNHRRSFNRLLNSMNYGLDEYGVTVDVRDLLDTNRTSKVEVPMLLPHELIGSLHSYGWELFSSVMLGSVTEGDAHHMLGFHWQAVSGGEWAANHPAYTTHADVAPYLVPLRFHGDDASIKSLNGKKLCILSLHSEFSVGDPLQSRLVSCIIYDDWIIPGCTLHQLMEVWRWSWLANNINKFYKPTPHLNSSVIVYLAKISSPRCTATGVK